MSTKPDKGIFSEVPSSQEVLSRNRLTEFLAQAFLGLNPDEQDHMQNIIKRD